MTNFFQWLDDQGYSYQILNQQKKNRGGAQVRITHNGNVVDCWPGANDVTHHVSARVYYDGLGLNGVGRVIENRPSESDKQRLRKKARGDGKL